ncbi:MAG: nucleotide sugar dehydrogenase [Patescibacteria group bacterium]|nr:nucleotide sugar dehydrogenase [Patescibacteria group bacterium]MDE2438439.1 nucleotide sugar dehydrogenase [Patescibacteria group bacterium]
MKKELLRKKIVVVGMGYIGFPTAVLFAKAGFVVCGVDIDSKKIDMLSRGISPFEEPGLNEAFRLAKNRMTFSTEIESGDVYIIAVPTPLDTKRHKADLSFVKAASHSVASVLTEGALVVLESTVPPGTAEKLCHPIFQKKTNRYYLAHAPERAFPQKTLFEMVQNDRIIGGSTKDAGEYAKKIYGSFVKGSIILTDATTAEFVKVLENSFRDVNIAFANEVAKVCEGIGVNVWEAISLANRHPRVNILNPGPGVGGHCIAVDPWFLLEGGVPSRFIKLAREINDAAPDRVVRMIQQSVKGINNPVIGILGVAYKKNIDDSRETPAKHIIETLKKRGYAVYIHDPFVKKFDVPLDSLQSTLSKSNCLVLVTDHDNYRKLDFKNYKNITHIVDTRNFFHNVPPHIRLITLGTPFHL